MPGYHPFGCMLWLLLVVPHAMGSDPLAQACAPNEHYNACGTACEVTCADLGQVLPCNRACTPGCFCNQGYVLDAPDGNCILQTDCPAQCPGNEEYKTCGTACQTTCADLGQAIACPAVCIEGCFCPQGYVRAETDGDCIETSSCPAQCPGNEEYKTCGAPCQTTCADLGQVIACPAICTEGCFCPQGYVRAEANGDCIETSSCPIDIGFSSTGGTVNEDAGWVEALVSLSRPATENILVQWGTTGITATDGEDFDSSIRSYGSPFTLYPGATTAAIGIQIQDDDIYEGDETFIITLDSVDPTSVAITNDEYTVTIVENEANPCSSSEWLCMDVQVCIPKSQRCDGVGDCPDAFPDEQNCRVLQLDSSTATVTEGNRLDLGMTLTGGLLEYDLSVQWSVFAETAAENEDFVLWTSDPLWIYSPAVTAAIAINTIDDDIFEGTETFRVQLDAVAADPASGVTLPVSIGSLASTTVSIVDYEFELQFDSSSTTVGEDDGYMYVPMTLSGVAPSDFEVSWSINDGTAARGVDFDTSYSNPFTFSAGDTTAAIGIDLMSDELVEGDESFTVTLNSASLSNVQIGATNTITVHIADADHAPVCGQNWFEVTRGKDAVGTQVWTVLATDADGDVVHFALRNPQGVPFTVDADTGGVLIGDMSLVQGGAEFHFEVIVTDNQNAQATCSVIASILSVCGDRTIQAWETCDDGNQNDGDGCSSLCATEAGHRCFNVPSDCYPYTQSEGATFVYLTKESPGDLYNSILATCQGVHESLVPPVIRSGTQNSDIVDNIPQVFSSATNPVLSVPVKWKGRRPGARPPGWWKTARGGDLVWYPPPALPPHTSGVDCMVIEQATKKWIPSVCTATVNILCELKQGATNLREDDSLKQQNDNTVTSQPSSGGGLLSFVIGAAIGVAVAGVGAVVYLKKFGSTGPSQEERARAPSLVLKSGTGSRANLGAEPAV
eukprot:TRINITY_DN67049_c0_g1_i2.p1 TRINITY_DN67049_c0_g1~~TRINITY_DN67049_c0_g1_i2.p1  ORF type:complete len:957 (-),score=142.68 TRINITY_DN67049_c0_g1_i2:201-3071(-)